MTKKEFMPLWQDMCAALPSKVADNPKIMLMYYDEAISVPDSDADKLLKRVLKECDYFPKLTHFSEICSGLKAIESPLSGVKNKESCDYCLNSGLIFDVLHGDSNLVYICPMCEKGKSMKKPSVRFYDERYGNEGLDEVKEYNLKKREEMGDFKEYFFKMIDKFGVFK